MTIFLSSIFRVKDVGFEVVQGGGLQWKDTVEAVTAIKNEGYLCNTTTAAFTLTLPSGPAIGDQVGIKDANNNFDTNALTVNPNGSKIEGSVNSVTVSDEGFYTVLIYTGSDRGWVHTDTRTHVGQSNFVGSGSEVTIPHGFTEIPTNVTAVAISDPGGYLGEVWARKDATNLYIGNSGSYTGAFDWSASI